MGQSPLRRKYFSFVFFLDNVYACRTNAVRQHKVWIVDGVEAPVEPSFEAATDDVRQQDAERVADVTEERTGAVVADVTLALHVTMVWCGQLLAHYIKSRK